MHASGWNILRSSPPAGDGVRVPVAPVVRWTFFLFLFSLPIEGLTIADAPVTFSRILGYLLLLASLLQPQACYARKPAAFWWFAAFLGIYTALALFQPLHYAEETFLRVFSLLQMLALFWIGCNLLCDPRVADGALKTIGVSFALAAGLQLAGISGEPPASTARVAAFGRNPNAVATVYAIGILVLVGLGYTRTVRARWPRLLAWLLLSVLALALVQTGSRSGMLCLAAGLAALMFAQGTRRSRFRNGLLVVLLGAALVVLSYFSETARQRWESTLTQGSLSHREDLYSAAVDMVVEKPILGWGPTTQAYELGHRTRYVRWENPAEGQRDVQNVILLILTATGIVGFIPFAVGTWLCLTAAWRARRGPEGILPFALVVAMLVMSLSSDWVYLKIYWVVLAYAVASALRQSVTNAVVAPERPARTRFHATRLASPLGGIPSA